MTKTVHAFGTNVPRRKAVAPALSTTSLKISIAALSLVISASAASAGGFAVREQSASLLGSAFAGAAAGVDLSSAFWNPAAFGMAQDGLTTQSSYTGIVADTQLKNATTTPGIGGADHTSIDKFGYLGSSYGAVRLNDKIVAGVSITAPYGLSTDADNYNWAGRIQGQSANMFSFNVNPTMSYEIMPGVHVAAGPAFEYLRLKMWQAGGVTPGNNTSIKVKDGLGIGFTAGILVETGKKSSIGLGYRSGINHDLSGKFNPLGAQVNAKLKTPDMITLSAVQAITDRWRVLGTVEWTNWSRVGKSVPIDGLPGAALDTNWDDGWLFSGGVEYDYSPALTLRAGAAYEKSPMQNPEQRLVTLPDTDRVWISGGFSYKYSDRITFDAGYSHIFFDNGHITRTTLQGGPPILNADVSNSADIFSVGMRTRW